MRNKVKQFIQKKTLLAESSSVIVGLSGGADSVVLLHILHQLGFSCMAAHCNFHLRGEESMEDERFAASLAASWKIPYHSIDFNTHAIASERKISIEMAARDLRYKWFEQLRRNLDASAIAVAHHQDDSVETMLLNLIRGTGIKGLTGIKPRNEKLIRPLLCLSKKEILQYAEEEDLSYVTDSSNLQDSFTRNKIRLQVLPLLQTINPSVSDALLQTMENLEEAGMIYDAGIQKACTTVFDKDKGMISIQELIRCPSPESVLYEILKGYGFKKEVVKTALDAMDAQSGKVFYSSGYRLCKDRDAFLLSRRGTNDTCQEYRIDADAAIVQQPFPMEITHLHYTHDFQIVKDKQSGYFDAEKLQFPLILRKWQAGDRFIPFGMKKFQKLSDYFNDHKFTLFEKEDVWILYSGNDILWIVGHRTDNRFRITEGTKKVCMLKLL